MNDQTNYGLDANDYTADMTAYIVEGEILNNIFGPCTNKYVSGDQDISVPVIKVFETSVCDTIDTAIYNFFLSSLKFISSLKPLTNPIGYNTWW